jgi:hypothetical protein
MRISITDLVQRDEQRRRQVRCVDALRRHRQDFPGDARKVDDGPVLEDHRHDAGAADIDRIGQQRVAARAATRRHEIDRI